jgi:ABC-type glycerol-3-phosphate transport system substrate-binding protein
MTARLRILMETVPDTDVVAAMLPAFHAEHPEVRVEVEAMHYDHMSGPTLASLAADRPELDLVILDNPWVEGLAGAGRLEPLEARIAAAGVDWEGYYPTLRAAAEIGGRIWGVPFYTWTPGLVYRRDLWEAAGVPAPGSLEELAAAAKTLTTPGRAGIAMQPRAGYDLCEEFGSWLFAAGGAIQDGAGRVVLDSAAARHALAVYLDVHATAAPPGSLEWAFDDSLRALAEGRAAAAVNCNWAVPWLNSRQGPAPELAGRFALAPVPGGASVLGVWYWAIPTNARDKETAWAFIAWIAANERERVARGGAPVAAAALTDPAAWADGLDPDAYYRPFDALHAGARPLVAGPNAEEVIVAVGQELHPAVAGAAGVDEAVGRAARRAEALLAG